MSPSGDVKKSNVPGHDLRKYGIPFQQLEEIERNTPVCAGSSVVIRLDLKETRSLVEQQRFSAVASVHYCRYEGANSGNISGNFCQIGFCPTI